MDNITIKVEVVPYNPDWPQLFEREAELIRSVLGPELTALHHIGSTSVRDLAAKPIIDIMPVVRGVNRVDQHNAKFEAAGCEYMGEFGIPGRRYSKRAGLSVLITCIQGGQCA